MDKNVLLKKIISDLGINVPFEKGKTVAVKNCWHFSTDGNKVDAIFEDEVDFKEGMNRVFIVLRKFPGVIILAFTLMDTHVHFILWGDFDECNRFVHEYIRRTSMQISERHGAFKKLEDVPVHFQRIGSAYQLKVCICYVIKNPPVGGLGYNSLDYPWSSSPLYFRSSNLWSSPSWMSNSQVRVFGEKEKRKKLKTRDTLEGAVNMVGDIVFPGEYVAYEVVEMIFKTCKSFNYFLCNSKESDVESQGGTISLLSIPMQEMRQNKRNVCKELFGSYASNHLTTQQRLRLAKVLRSRYNSSKKQILRLCGLVYEECKDLI